MSMLLNDVKKVFKERTVGAEALLDLDITEHKAYFLHLVFYKYLSIYGESLGLVIPKEHRFDIIKDEGAEKVSEALLKSIKQIYELNESLKPFFISLRNPGEDEFVYKVYKLLKNLEDGIDWAKLFNEVILGVDELLVDFLVASYSPRNLGTLAREMFTAYNENEKVSIYDPGIGVGNMVIEFLQGDKNAAVYGHEFDHWKKEQTIMNCYLNGITEMEISDACTMLNPHFIFEETLQTFDYVISDQATGIGSSGMYKKEEQFYINWKNGPELQEEAGIYTAFLKHSYNSIKEGGEGSVFINRAKLNEYDVDFIKELAENNHLLGIVDLPDNLLFNLFQPKYTMIMMTKRPHNGDVFVLNARNKYKLKSNGVRSIDHDNLQKIARQWRRKERVEGISELLSKDEFISAGASLDLRKYIDIPLDEV